MKNKLITLLLPFLFSINLFAIEIDNNSQEENINNSNKSTEIASYDLGFIIKLIQEKSSKTNNNLQIEKIENELEKILKNLKEEITIQYNIEEYEKNLNYLNNKIDINSKHENNLAVSRDIIKIIILQNEKVYAETINSIIEAKNSFKNRIFFIKLLDEKRVELESINLDELKELYNSILLNQDSLSKEYKTVFKYLDSQIKANLLIFDYLKTNINKYREKIFIIDELSLKYIIEKIDNNPYSKNFSNILNYYFNISIGKITVLLSIFIFFIILNKIIIPFCLNTIKSILTKNFKLKIDDLIPKSFGLTISLLLYIFALEISLFLILEDNQKIYNLTPWFNTLYLSIISLLFYRILTNYINISSDEIFKHYPNMRKEMVDFVLRITKVLIVVFLILFLLIQLNLDIKAILASLGIGGIAVALAAKDTLSNFFGSLNIITDNSFSQGDWIEAGNIEGTVVDIRMRTTRIRTFANAMITVPNAQLANMAILNWSKRVIGRRIKMSLNITYSSKMSDIEKLVEDLRFMLQNHPQIATNKLSIDKKPYLLKKEDLIGIKNNLLVYIDEYSNSSINILIYCFSKSANWEDWLETKQDVIIKISELVKKNSCEFAFPTQTIYIENEEKA